MGPFGTIRPRRFFYKCDRKYDIVLQQRRLWFSPMAFIVYFYKDEEQGRIPLDGPIQVGRSPECEVAVRDILLSRHHLPKGMPTNGILMGTAG